jgi:hypothetical protein
MPAEPVLVREEALALCWIVSDILAELQSIRRLLEDGEEEEDLED